MNAALPGLTRTRRSFLFATGTIATTSFLPFAPSVLADTPAPKPEGINVLGPRPGYSPQIGTLVSMLTWMRSAPLSESKGLTQPQLDWLFDKNANSIGALLLHLAATETLYQRLTFDNITLDQLRTDKDYNTRFGSAMELGDDGRKEIKGHDLGYYTAILAEVREKSLAEFKKRDDAWLMAVDKTWGWGPTNTYCKWFHVCEHESHHSGQIALLAKRVPGAKPSSEGL
jgi:uncharacterized damage-inducible protein DinB